MSKRGWMFFAPLAVFVILVIALLAVLAGGALRAHKFATHLNAPAPALHLPILKGDVAFDVSDWRGRPYILNFFASWCVPCRAEHEYLQKLAGDHVPVIGIAYKDAAGVSDFLTHNGNPYLFVALDTNGRVGIDWGLTGVPETFVVDAQGVIRFHLSGPLTDDIVTAQIEPLWRSLQP